MGVPILATFEVPDNVGMIVSSELELKATGQLIRIDKLIKENRINISSTFLDFIELLIYPYNTTL